MSTQSPSTPDEGTIHAVGGLVDALGTIEDVKDVPRLIYSKGENTRYIRHAQVLNRWPILPEEWARKVENTRISSVDRTPGAATFGR